MLRSPNSWASSLILQVMNKRGLKIQASHYEPIEAERSRKALPCVIYLHGNCGSRLDAIDCLPILLPYNITLVSLDFTGSGLSEGMVCVYMERREREREREQGTELWSSTTTLTYFSAGEYVSLGYYEKDDLAAVVDHLRETGSVSRIGLWGRSMGAAVINSNIDTSCPLLTKYPSLLFFQTSIMYGAGDPSIACMILDSPFSGLTKVAKELVESAQARLSQRSYFVTLVLLSWP